MGLRTEDAVRDGYAPSDGTAFVNGARQILGFDKVEAGVRQGTGQITTFNHLGFTGVIDKPDGWYLPDDYSKVAIVLETKAEKEDVANEKWVKELQKNMNIVSAKYNKVIGILYNGKNVRVFKNEEEMTYAFPITRCSASHETSALTTRSAESTACSQIRSCSGKSGSS